MSRYSGRLHAIVRTSWRPAAWGVAGGFLLEALLPVGAPWLPAAAASVFTVLALLCLAAGSWTERHRPRQGLADVDERLLGRAALLERWSTPAQFGYAFGSAALLLLALALGLGIADLSGFGS